MSDSGPCHASSSTHPFPLDDHRIDVRAQEPVAGRDPQASQRRGGPSRPRRASTGTWSLRACAQVDDGNDNERDAARVDSSGSTPCRSSREIPESHEPPPVDLQDHYNYDYDDDDDVLNSPAPSSPSAKSLSLALSEDHIQLARAAALARTISKQRAAGVDPPQPLSPPKSASQRQAPMGSWWSFLPGAAADGSRVPVADSDSEPRTGRRRSAQDADVGPSLGSWGGSTSRAQKFGPRDPIGRARQHPAVAKVRSPIDRPLTDGSRSQTGLRVGRRIGDVREQLHGWRLGPPLHDPQGARPHADSPGCAVSPDKAPVRGLWNPNLVPMPSVTARRLPPLGAGLGLRGPTRAGESARYVTPLQGIQRARAGIGVPSSLTSSAETKTAAGFSARSPDRAALRMPARRVNLATVPYGAGAGVLHSEEGLSTASERRALYQFDQLMLARGLIGVFKLRSLQKVVDGERYWQYKCTLLVMEPYPSDTCVYRGARVTRSTRVEAKAAAAGEALSALSLSPIAARRTSLSPVALMPNTPCPPYRRDPQSPELLLRDLAPGPNLTHPGIPPYLVVTREEPDELYDTPSETRSVGTQTPSHGSMSPFYELVDDDPDLLGFEDRSQLPRSVSVNAASRLQWPGEPPPDEDGVAVTRHRPASR